MSCSYLWQTVSTIVSSTSTAIEINFHFISYLKKKVWNGHVLKSHGELERVWGGYDQNTLYMLIKFLENKFKIIKKQNREH